MEGNNALCHLVFLLWQVLSFLHSKSFCWYSCKLEAVVASTDRRTGGCTCWILTYCPEEVGKNPVNTWYVFTLKRLPRGNWGVSLCEEDLRRQHEPWGGDETLLSSRCLADLPSGCVSPGICCTLTVGHFFYVLQTQVTLGNQCNKQLWIYKTPHVNKTPPRLAHSSALGIFLNTYLMSASFVLIHSNTPKQQQLKHRFLQLVQSCSCMIIFSPSCCLLREVRFQESWSFSLVQTNFQEQILMEKYDVIPFSGGGNNVGADCRTPDFTISVLKFKVWHTIRW